MDARTINAYTADSDIANVRTATTHSAITTLKQHLENLFPGKWINSYAKQKTLLTGLPAIDQSLTCGIARKRITDWVGPISSGKTSVLRAIINRWCASGFSVAYVDTENRLIASDWIFIEQGKCATQPRNMIMPQAPVQSLAGKFWVVHTNDNKHTKLKFGRQNNLWATDELIRSNVFDAVVLDLGSSERTKPIPGRVYARLQNSLSRSNTALILVRDSEFFDPLGWGSYAQIGFRWGPTFNFIEGLHGAVMILPSVNCSVIKDGLSHTTEVQISSHVANRLFTHPQVPDRRTSKT